MKDEQVWHILMDQVEVLTADDITWTSSRRAEEIYSENMPLDDLRAFKWDRKWLVPPSLSHPLSQVHGLSPFTVSTYTPSSSSLTLATHTQKLNHST